jgi:uroporphyrinogen decarboxylase
VKRYKGRRAIRFSHRAAFMWSAYLMDLDNLLANMLIEPETVHLLMDKVLETNIRLAVNAIRAGAEIVTLGDDYAHNLGPLMSPECFAEFIQPRLKRMVDAVHEEGALVIKHSDGNLYSILEAIVGTGIDCLNPIEPVAGMDLATVKRLVGGRVSLCGNIDCGQLLPHGTVQDVAAAVRQAVQDAAVGGGFLLASSNSIHSSCQPANFAAMIAAGHAYGCYPVGG